MRVHICGSSAWKTAEPIDTVISGYIELTEGAGEDLVIVHGNEAGADRLADQIATQWAVDVKRIPADWDRYGQEAGPMNNTKILDEEKLDVVWAFRATTGKSSVTDDMCKQAAAAGVPVFVVTEYTEGAA
jgi:hypothetical protein